MKDRQALECAPPSRGSETAGRLIRALARAFRLLCQRDRAAERHDRLRLVSRLALAAGGTVSVIEWDTQRFLIATGSKGDVAMLALQGQPGQDCRRLQELKPGRVQMAGKVPDVLPEPAPVPAAVFIRAPKRKRKSIHSPHAVHP